MAIYENDNSYWQTITTATTDATIPISDNTTWSTTTNPNIGNYEWWKHAVTNPLTPQPQPVETKEVEVLVRQCPSCEEVKRVDDHWTGDDYICDECRYGEAA